MELTKKQKEVMEQIFTGDENEDAVLVSNNISRRVFDVWITEDAWVQEFDRRIEQSKRETQVIITRFQTSAAIKLVELMGSKNATTGRAACLDIIQMPRIASEAQHVVSVESLEISEEVKESIIELLAKDARKKRKKKSDIDKKRS